MAGIDDIISGVGGNTRADFSHLSDGFDAYNNARDQKAKNDLRDAFKGGVPLTPDGQPDFGAMAKTLFQKGGLSEGTAAANLGLAQQNMQFGQGQSRAISGYEGGQPQAQAPLVSPPSANRSAQAVVAPPLNKGGVQGPGQAPQAQAPQDQPTVMKIMAAQGIPNDQLGTVSASVARQLGVDPTAPLDVNDPQVRNVLVPAIARFKKMNLGQVQPSQPGDNQPQAPQAPPQIVQAPQPQMAPQGQPAPVTNAVTTTAAPATPSRIDQGIAFYAGILSDPRSPKQNVELAKSRLEALQKNSALTDAQKEYAQAVTQGFKGTMQDFQVTMEGQKSQASEQAKLTTAQREYDQAKKQGFKGTLEDWQNRTDENTTQRDILNKSLLPRVDASQEKATAARDDIDAIHRARQELDQKGGVFSGAFADKKLYLAKAAELLGVPNADKIANTEAYGAAIGQRVAVMVKAFGSGTAISDGDRRFAAAMAGGQVTLDENSMRRILDIGEKANRGKIAQHNEFVDKIVGSNEGLKPARNSFIVKAPGDYAKPSAAVFDSARDAIAKGAPRDAVMKRLRENGHDPAGL